MQYRESDFDFASRLMEEEGIYYFFKHTDGKHQMMVTDIKNPTVESQSTVIYEELFGGSARRNADHGLGEGAGTALGRVHALGSLL